MSDFSVGDRVQPLTEEHEVVVEFPPDANPADKADAIISLLYGSMPISNRTTYSKPDVQLRRVP